MIALTGGVRNESIKSDIGVQVLAVRDVTIEPTFGAWRNVARRLLAADVPPECVAWRDLGDTQGDLLYAHDAKPSSTCITDTCTNNQGVENQLNQRAYRQRTGSSNRRVPKEFIRIAESVACHSDKERWHVLYRVLFRLTHGEPSLLDVATDPDIHTLFVMDKTIRREVHKMHAFVRFRAVEDSSATHDGINATTTTYVAWFEPLHNVVERASGLFIRRFASMRWTILTPMACVHWDGSAAHFTTGVSRAMAPREDQLEELWRSYYAHIFNPARVSISTMQTEMPRRYWVNLPEAGLIQSLAREAPARVTRMLTQLQQPAAEIPVDMRSQIGVVTEPERVAMRSVPAISVELDTPGDWDPTHDPGVTAAKVRIVACARPNMLHVHDVPVRIGTASWTDPTLLHPGVFYPDSATTPETRLQFYAAHHSLVEVDSTYYVPPTRSMSTAWASRSPADFVFNIKAYALMTGHAAETKRMPDWLRRLLPRAQASAQRVYANDLPTRVLDEVWSRFLGALGPLNDAEKLGPILLQFPRWFAPSRASAALLRVARERLGTVGAAVEFRNPEWVTGRVFARTVALLEKLQLTYVVVDAPPGTASSMPPVAPITTPELCIVRLHGRRAAAWEARHRVVSERYRYLYDRDELSEWTNRIGEIASRLESRLIEFPDMAKAKQGVHVVFNNCHANYGTTNTEEITQMLIKFDRQRRGIID